MKRVIQERFLIDQSKLDHFVKEFAIEGEQFGVAERNSIKLFQLNDLKINIKSFKVPNIFNQIAYRFFRKSKAQRSFEFANKLLNSGIGTPQPIAYYEFTTPFLFKRSYYISEHTYYDLTYRELLTNLDYPNHEAILRAFTRFTYQLHEKGIHFLDHSPGNTLIQIKQDSYTFYLVDLNRMQFGPMHLKTRIKNFSKLTIYKSMVEVMSDEYSKCSGEDYNTIFNLMWTNTQNFQAKYHRKRKLKNKLLFWRAPK